MSVRVFMRFTKVSFEILLAALTNYSVPGDEISQAAYNELMLQLRGIKRVMRMG